MEILLGQGAFKIDGVIVGLTRGGGSFGIEQEIKDIEADGDYGPVKGRQKITNRTPKLKLKRLQRILADFTKMYPNMKTTTTTTYSGVTWSGTGIQHLCFYSEGAFIISKIKISGGKQNENNLEHVSNSNICNWWMAWLVSGRK